MIFAFFNIFLSWMAMKTETLIGRFEREIKNLERDLIGGIYETVEILQKQMENSKRKKKK